MSKSSLIRRAAEAREWLMDGCFPLWSTKGVEKSGLFAEALSIEHQPIAGQTHRVRVQARQTYVFSEAYRLGWAPLRAKELIELGHHVLLQKCIREDGLVGKTLTQNATGLLDDTPDLYDLAFVVFALAETNIRHPDGVNIVREDINAILLALDTNLKDKSAGGYFEALPPRTERLQNPHMHLFEAFLSLHLAYGEKSALDRAAELLSLFLSRLAVGKNDLVAETYSPDWSEVTDETVEPGHQFEWVWLLYTHSRIAGFPLPPEARSLYAFGRHTKTDDGKVPLITYRNAQPIDASYRIWPHTEAIKAHLAMFEATHDEAHLSGACESFDCLLENHLTPQGGWIDHIDVSGTILSEHMPASSGYHIVSGLKEMIRIAESL